jgi:hypothetical protein
MIGLAALLSLVSQVSGTPYIPGGDSPAGTDCSGLASWVANVASGRPAFGSRFNTGNMESALLARGFHYGSAPGSVVIGWNSGHAAVTLPDGTPVSSGESGSGVRVGGGGAYQPQFSHHMYLPVQAQRMDVPAEAAPAPAPAPAPESGPPAEAVPAPAPEFGAPPEPAPAPEGAFGAGAVIELTAAAPPVDGAPAPVEAPAPIDAPVPPVDPALPPPA